MKKSRWWVLLFLVPSLVAFSYTVIIPLITGVYYSFTGWNGIATNPEVVGLANYIEILTTDKEFLQAFLFTSAFTLCSVITINIGGFLLALMVTNLKKGSNAARSIFFLPNLIGGLILGFLWNFIFTKSFDALGERFGILWLQGWLSSTWTGFIGLLIVMTWQMAGYMMIIYIAALEGIDASTLEAAQIDGASPLQRLRKIIIPMVASAFTVGIFFSLSNSFKLFDQNLALTAGGPHRSTEMLALNIYKTAFTYNSMGVAQAKAVIFLIIVATITIIQLSISKRKEIEA